MGLNQKSESTRPAQGNNFPPLSDLLYCELASHPLVREQAMDILERASWEPDERVRHGMYRRLIDFVCEIRGLGERGFGVYWPVGFAFVMCLIFAYMGHRESLRDFTYSAPLDKFQILRRYDAYHYQFSHLNRAFSVTFCPNYEPQLSAGQTLTWIHYADLGRCWDILPEGYGYRLERDAAGKPTLAPPCFVNDRDVTECKPNPTEARF